MQAESGRAFPSPRAKVLATPVAIAVSAALIFPPQYAYGLPSGGEVVAGNVAVTIDGNQMRLDQTSRAAIMNWQQFNIAPNELVRILQNGTDAAMLARVTGGNPSELLGRLQADGKLFLINPQGVLVGPGAMIDTAAFLASTLDVADADFLKQGALTFKGDSDAGVVNLGKITAHEGNVVLLARTVKNSGELAAANGSVGLGAGSEVYLASPDAPTFIVKANLPSTGTTAVGVDNTGVITAAQAQLEAAGGSIYDLAVNHSGIVRATGIERQPDGRILITAAGGNVSVSGSAAARDADGSGGEILVGGDYRGGNVEVANAAKTHVGASAVLDASASSTTGDGGRVIVWADKATAFLGSLNARAGAQGGDGGFAEVSGKHSLAFDGAVDLSATAGKRGELLLDPDNITIVAGTTTLPEGLRQEPYGWSWFEDDDPGDRTIGADSVANLLLNNSVALYASDTLTVSAPVTVASGGADSVTLTLSAPTLAINESVSLANVIDGGLRFFGGGGSAVSLTSAPNTTLTADEIFLDGFPIVALNGAVSADRLTYEYLAGTATSLIAAHPDNAIGNLTLVSERADPQPLSFSSNVAVHSGSPMNVTALIGSANNVTLSSAGDLRLLGTDEIGFMPPTTINAAGELRLASTGGVLINEAGAGLLEGSGRRLLYTSNTAGAFTLGGLSGYTQFDGVGFPNDPQGLTTLVLYNAAGAGPVLTLTITANDFTRLYGRPNPVFTASFSGGTSADLTLQPTFSIQGGPAVNVGTYTIVPSGAASGTHNIAYVNGTLRIDPAVLTYVANPASRLYGDMNPAFGGSVTGFVNGDTLASATTGTLTFESFATASSDAGLESILGGGLSANNGNYIFEQALLNHSALTIERAPLTVTAGNATRMYGSADPRFDAAITGFRNEDTASVLTSFGLISNATASSPVGAYEISGGGNARNYVLNFLPGTLTITPAPLTVEGLAVSSVYGNTHHLGYTVRGLLNGDTPDVLSGVMLDRAFFDTAAPGVYSYGFSRTGTAQNYEVTAITPGSLTIGRRVITGQVNDARSTQSAIPASFAATFTPPLFNGPQFTIEGALTQTAGLGQYTLKPVIKPLGRSTLAEIERYYTFDLQPGTLTVDQDEIKFIFDSSTLQDLVKKPVDVIKPDLEQTTKIVVGGGGGDRLTPHDLAEAARAFGPDFAALVPGVLEKEAAKDLTADQVLLLEEIRNGKLTSAELGSRIRNDPAAASAIMPLLSQAVLDAVESGKELTWSQQMLVARIANHVNEQRRILKEELKNQLREFEQQKAAIGASNPYALKTMPDIAISAQQAATERALGAVFGAVGGAALGGIALVGVNLSVTVIAPFAAQGGTAIAAAGGAALPTAIIGIAVAAVVIGVQAAILVGQEQQNKDAYNTMMSRANTHADAKLAGLDLKNDKLAKAEFLNAFTMAMFETGMVK